MDIEPILYNYTTILMTEDGKRYDISNLIENLGWEEPEKELFHFPYVFLSGKE